MSLFIEFFHYARVRCHLDRKSQLLRVLKRLAPSTILEIGVNDGKNALRMIGELNKNEKHKLRYVGLDLFSNQMTASIALHEASPKPLSKQNVERLLKEKFPDLDFSLVEGYSNDTLSELSEKFSFIFIDGGHSYETVKSDLELAKGLLDSGGTIVLDDYTNSRAEKLANFGVTRLVKELDRKEWNVSLSKLPDIFQHEWGVLITRLVILKPKNFTN